MILGVPYACRDCGFLVTLDYLVDIVHPRDAEACRNYWRCAKCTRKEIDREISARGSDLAERSQRERG